MSANHSSTVAAPSADPRSVDGDRIIIFDTTLRDGEQSPGASMTVAEKLRIAEVLEQMGVDVIEAGFAIASEGDFRAVNQIAKKIKDSVVCSLARAGRADIDRAAEALEPAARKRIHTFIATSPLHMRVKLQMTPEQVHEAVIDSVTRARRYCDDVEWSCEDGSRSEHDFLCRCIESAIAAGAAHDQHPGHGRLRLPRGVRRSDPDDQEPRAEHRPGGDLGALPQRSGPGRGELAARDRGRRPPGRVHDQRHRRARRQRRHGRDRHGAAHAPRPAAVLRPGSSPSTSPGHRAWSARSRASPSSRTRRSSAPTRSPTRPASIRTACSRTPAPTRSCGPEDVGLVRSSLVMGKHSGPPRLPQEAGRAGLRARRQRADRGVRPLQGAGRQEEGDFRRGPDRAGRRRDPGQPISTSRCSSWTCTAARGRSRWPRSLLEIGGERREAQAQGDGPVDATFNAIKQLVPHSANAGAVPDPRRDRGHRCPGGGHRAARGERQDG